MFCLLGGLFNRLQAKNPLCPTVVPKHLDSPLSSKLATDRYIRDLFLKLHAESVKPKKSYLAMQLGEVLKFDATFNESKHIRVDGAQV